jgi:hypothetical protein
MMMVLDPKSGGTVHAPVEFIKAGQVNCRLIVHGVHFNKPPLKKRFSCSI